MRFALEYIAKDPDRRWILVSSGEMGAAKVGVLRAQKIGRLQSAVPKLIFSGMAVAGTFLIGQMSFWCVLPGVMLSYGGLIGLTVTGRESR